MRFSDNWGRLAENVVFLELLRREQTAGLHKIFYWYNQRQQEVDFVVKEGTKVIDLIQVCWDTQHIRTYEREVRSLQTAMQQFKSSRGTLIVAPGRVEDNVQKNGMHCLSLREWLTTQN